MAEISVYHNPKCSTSRNALAMAEEAGVDVDVVLYLTTKPSAAELTELIAKLEDPATDLVRRDGTFKELGLTDADVETPEQVVAVLAANPKLMQRPVVITANRAFIGRPKERVAEFFGG